MSTTMLPETPVPGPPPLTSDRVVTIRANLLPDVVIGRRRLREIKRMIAVALALVLVLMLAWYLFAVLQTSSARSDRDSAKRKAVSLTKQSQQFAPLIAAQNQSLAIKTELTKLMVGDLQWKNMLAVIRAKAPGGVVVNSITATVTTGGAPSGSTSSVGGGLGVLNQTGKLQVGTLTIVGSAPDKNSVAAYLDALTKVPGLAAPYPASVTGDKGKLTFTANVIITSDSLGGRYAKLATSTGGH
jgi:Tfp pilus assembly protein PilN